MVRNTVYRTFYWTRCKGYFFDERNECVDIDEEIEGNLSLKQAEFRLRKLKKTQRIIVHDVSHRKEFRSMDKRFFIDNSQIVESESF